MHCGQPKVRPACISVHVMCAVRHFDSNSHVVFAVDYKSNQGISLVGYALEQIHLLNGIFGTFHRTIACAQSIFIDDLYGHPIELMMVIVCMMMIR